MRKPEKLSEHIFRLLEYLRDEGDMDLVYAIDDEGNAFHKVYHHPTIGMYNRGQYLSETEYEQALKVKGPLRWRDVLLQAIDMQSEKRRQPGRPRKSLEG